MDLYVYAKMYMDLTRIIAPGLWQLPDIGALG